MFKGVGGQGVTRRQRSGLNFVLPCCFVWCAAEKIAPTWGACLELPLFSGGLPCASLWGEREAKKERAGVPIFCESAPLNLIL